MARTPITGPLLTGLLATARADGVAFVRAAAVVEDGNSILLLHRGDGDDFLPYSWELPSCQLIPDRDQLGDVIHRAVTRTAGHHLNKITGYLGYHDQHHPAIRTFGFTVTITDAATTCRDARWGHQWLRAWRRPLRFPDGTDDASQILTGLAVGIPAPAPRIEPELADPLRAGARGLYAAEAACELLIASHWLHRGDFTPFITTATSCTDGATELAHIDWHAATAAHTAGRLPSGGAETRILRLAASIAAGIPVDLNQALSSLDGTSINHVVRAVRHANGDRPQ
jgi:hypothetical protein